MRRGERTYEVKTNGIPQLKEMPKDLLNLLCTALLDAVLEKKGVCGTEKENSGISITSEKQ